MYKAYNKKTGVYAGEFKDLSLQNIPPYNGLDFVEQIVVEKPKLVKSLETGNDKRGAKKGVRAKK